MLIPTPGNFAQTSQLCSSAVDRAASKRRDPLSSLPYSSERGFERAGTQEEVARGGTRERQPQQTAHTQSNTTRRVTGFFCLFPPPPILHHRGSPQEPQKLPRRGEFTLVKNPIFSSNSDQQKRKHSEKQEPVTSKPILQRLSDERSRIPK